ncbi:hypothetical protein [Nocardia abscessus]|uniref:hypothetical protein n=1 Tax=Nocardia abscessus TaxID=120957 RepID=UPI001E468C45|nr:hypothetical protein [Nocardia abscessus]
MNALRGVGARIEFRRDGSIDHGLIDQCREPRPHHIIGPGQRGIQSGLVDRSWMDPDAPGFPLRDQAFVHAQMGGEFPDAHPLGIAKGAGLFA